MGQHCRHCELGVGICQVEARAGHCALGGRLGSLICHTLTVRVRLWYGCGDGTCVSLGIRLRDGSRHYQHSHRGCFQVTLEDPLAVVLVGS